MAPPFPNIYQHVTTGIDDCHPKSPNWIRYNEDCCTYSDPCNEAEGGCTSDGHCEGDLVCSASPYDCNGFDTAAGELCCHTHSGERRYRIIVILCLLGLHILSFLAQNFVFKYILDCCETVTIYSISPAFYTFNAFGLGTYRKDAVDGRDRIIYRNNDHALKGYGLGDFMLYYEPPNEGGRENWVVRTFH